MKITIIYNDIGGEKLPVLSDEAERLESWPKLSVSFAPVMVLARDWAGILDGAGIHTADGFARLYHQDDTHGGAGYSDEVKKYLPLIDELKKDEKAGAFIYSAVCLYLECGKDFDFANYISYAIKTRDGDAVEISTENAKAWQSVHKIQADLWDVVGTISDKLKNIMFNGVCDDTLKDFLEDPAPAPAPPVEDPDETQPQEDKPKPVNIPGITPPPPTEKKTRGRKKTEGTPAQGDAPKAEAQGVEIVEAETETKSPVSYDFYKMLEESQATEKTKRLAEYIAVCFGERIRNFSKQNPEYNAKKKAEIVKGGAWTLPIELLAPIILTPQQLAKEIIKDYAKIGKTKAIKKALETFAPLRNASITREVIDEKTGQIVKRVTPIFSIEYDFTEGTPDDVIKRFKESPADFVGDPDAVNALQNIRIFASVPMITNQFTNVVNGDTWKNKVFTELNEDKTKGARRLGVCNVPKIEACKILPVDEMAKRIQARPGEQKKLYNEIATLANELYNTDYHHDAKKKSFVKTTPTPGNVNKPTKQTQRQTKGRGRPRKTT